MSYYGTKSGEGVKRTREAIAEKRPFKAGSKFSHVDDYSMRGSTKIDGAGNGFGRLPVDLQERFSRDRPNYIVYSFGTPIAWYVPFKGWYIPDVRYSPTTSNHQTQCRYAVREYTVNW